MLLPRHRPSSLLLCSPLLGLLTRSSCGLRWAEACRQQVWHGLRAVFLCCIVSMWTPITSLTNGSLCTGTGAALGGSAASAASVADQMHSAGLGQPLDPAGQPGRAPLITSDLFGSAMQAAMSSLEQAAPQVTAVRELDCTVS